MEKGKVAVLASGGLDSNVLLGYLLKKYRRVHPLYVRSGFVWEKAELYWLRRFLKAVRSRNLMPLTILSLPFFDLWSGGWAMTGRRVPGSRSPDEEVYLPGRNLLLLSKAATFAAMHRIPVIAIGSLKGNPFPDAGRRFFRRLGETASEGLGFPIRVTAPFLAREKGFVSRLGRGLPLHLSFSCLSPRGLRSCGRCNKCAERERCRLG